MTSTKIFTSLSKTLTTMSIILLLLIHLGFAFTEVVILAYNYIERECGPSLYACIIYCCAMHFLMAFYLFSLRRREQENYALLVNLLFGSGSGIWSFICYYNTSLDCSLIYRENYKNLWNVLLAEVVWYYILLAVFVVWLTGACYYCCRESQDLTPRLSHPNNVIIVTKSNTPVENIDRDTHNQNNTAITIAQINPPPSTELVSKKVLPEILMNKNNYRPRSVKYFTFDQDLV